MKLKALTVPPEKVVWGTASSPAGRLAIGLTDKGEICRISFLRGRSASDALSEWRAEWPKTKFSAGARVEKYSRLPVALVGTKFQQSVWRIMSKIPAGSVTTYGEIARYIGKPKASHAVGGACGANPVPYLIPCHRVVAANGGLGGFSGGLGIKEKLLKAEGYL